MYHFTHRPVKVEPPPPEPSWSEKAEAPQHLTAENFATFLADKEHALVMFYAPWCGHCKKAKPDMEAANAKLKDVKDKVIVAVDCTATGGRHHSV